MPTTTYGFDAGQPQPYPGCYNYIGEHAFVREGGYGWCDGCKSWQPLSGRRIADHEPSDPPYFKCPYCPNRYPFASYTNPPCDECAARIDIAEYLRNGGQIESVGEYWGEEGAALAYDMVEYDDQYE